MPLNFCDGDGKIFVLDKEPNTHREGLNMEPESLKIIVFHREDNQPSCFSERKSLSLALTCVHTGISNPKSNSYRESKDVIPTISSTSSRLCSNKMLGGSQKGTRYLRVDMDSHDVVLPFPSLFSPYFSYRTPRVGF